MRRISAGPLHLTPNTAEPLIRIALCDLPRMLADIVTVLIQDVPDLEIVACADAIGDCLNADNPGADLVICSVAEADLAPAWTAALSRRALPAVLNLWGDSIRGDLYALYPVQRELEDLTARSLLKAVDDHMRAANPGRVRSS